MAIDTVRHPSSGTGRPGGGSSRVRRSALVAALVCTGSLTLSPASHAAPPPAAAECQVRADARHTDWTGMNFLGDVVCPHNLANIRVQSTTQSTVNGALVFSPSWFVCWKKGGFYQGTDIWYYTQADTVTASKASKGYGYLSAAETRATTHPIPGLKKCDWA